MNTEHNINEPGGESPHGVERTGSRPVFRPRVDIAESEKAITLAAEVPGADETGVDVTLDKNVLTIRAQVEPVSLEGFSLVHREYELGDFERAFTVSDEIDREGIEAVVRDGVLRVTLPKAAKKGAKKISVSGG